MRNETQLVKDFAHQAAMDLQSVLPALQVINRTFCMIISLSAFDAESFAL